MASATVVAAATQGGSFSFSTFASSSCRPSPRPPLQARPSIPPSILHFPSRRRTRSLRVAACVPSRRPVAACVKSGPSCGIPKEDVPSVEIPVANASSPSSKEATFDMKLPRRNLLVQFTCNSCGERTQRLINRVAYERGTVFVQCAGCLVHHKLVDNLNLVVEYDLRNDTDTFDPTVQDGNLP